MLQKSMKIQKILLQIQLNKILLSPKIPKLVKIHLKTRIMKLKMNKLMKYWEIWMSKKTMQSQKIIHKMIKNKLKKIQISRKIEKIQIHHLTKMKTMEMWKILLKVARKLLQKLNKKLMKVQIINYLNQKTPYQMNNQILNQNNLCQKNKLQQKIRMKHSQMILKRKIQYQISHNQEMEIN